ncbi:MAG: hypothetical protein ACOZAM_06505 [Pseudomonadota bacterium]
MERLKRRPDRFVILAQRAREFARRETGIVAELYQQHAEICEGKAAAQMTRRKRTKRKGDPPMD